MSTFTEQTHIDKYTVRRALWRGLRWNNEARGYDLDAEKMSACLAQLVTTNVLAELLTRVDVDTYLAAGSKVDALVAKRCAEIMERVVAKVEEQGLAVPGVEGSIDRVLDSLIHTVNGEQS